MDLQIKWTILKNKNHSNTCCKLNLNSLSFRHKCSDWLTVVLFSGVFWQKWSRGCSGSKQTAQWITHSWPLTPVRTNWLSVPGNPKPALFFFNSLIQFLLVSSLFFLLLFLLYGFYLFFFFFSPCLLPPCMSNDQFLCVVLRAQRKMALESRVHCLFEARPNASQRVCVWTLVLFVLWCSDSPAFYGKTLCSSQCRLVNLMVKCTQGVTRGKN